MSDNQVTAAQGNTAAAAATVEPAKQESQSVSAAAPAQEKSTETLVVSKEATKPTEPPAKKEVTQPASELKLELPEGSKLKQTDVDRIASFAKDHGLSQDAAAALLKRESESVAQSEQIALAQLQEQSDAWKQEIINDTEFGGERANETAQMAHDFAKRFGDQEFVSELERTGLGNHPGLVKLFARAGRAMAPDSFKGGGVPPGSERKSPESKLYANTTPI